MTKQSLCISIDPVMRADIEAARTRLAQSVGERPSAASVVRECIRRALKDLSR